MFICSGQPKYGWEKLVTELSPAAFAEWKRGAISLRDKLMDADQATFKEKVGYVHELIMDDREVEAWAMAGVSVEISKIRGLASPGSARDLPQAIYQIAVANVGLLQIQTVDYLEDACTDELQRWLDRSWRILAVCPSNNTRRPTFIMGHFDKEPGQHNPRR